MSGLKSKLLNFFPNENQVGLRLDQALSFHPEIQTRSRATRLIQNQAVRVAGQLCKPSYRVQSGDSIQVDLPLAAEPSLKPLDLPLEIFFEDSDLLVVNKPAGLVVHPSLGHEENTLVNALVYHCKDLSMGFNEHRPGIIHRLDKDTSGLLVVAKNDESQEKIAEQFRNKTTRRKYWAIVIGEPRQMEGTFQSHLKRHPTQRKKFASEKIRADRPPTGKLAITHYRLLKASNRGLSLLECRLETGRTHQIRIHMSEGGHPIVGDTLYGGLRASKRLPSKDLSKQTQELGRLGLHAFELGFVHPKSKKEILFQAPWPPDLHPLLEELKWNG